MKEYATIIAMGEHIVDCSDTVRGTAKVFGASKTTVHDALTKKLPQICPELAYDVRLVLDKNKKERHLRGGKATSLKFRLLREKKA